MNRISKAALAASAALIAAGGATCRADVLCDTPWVPEQIAWETDVANVTHDGGAYNGWVD